MGIKLAQVLAVLLLSSVGDGAKILFFMGLATHSHRVALQPLGEKLADSGHDVTFLTHIKAKDSHPKIVDYFPKSLVDFLGSSLDDYAIDCLLGRLKQKHYDPFLDGSKNVYDFNIGLIAAYVRDSEFQSWVKESSFDLIIYDSPFKELAVGIAHKMKAKIIEFCTTSTQLIYEFEMQGLPAESSWLPDVTSGGSQYPLIPDHFMWAYNTLKFYYDFTWYYLPRIDELLEELYGEKLPPLEELLRKIDLIFVNEHFSATFPRSLPPFVVPVGGMHVKDSDGLLSKEVEAFMESRSRFVFISFGSGVKISDLPQDSQEMLFRTLASFEQNTSFLIKWNGDIPTNLPKNVLAQKWFPQQTVLAHTKCKGFISQGGAISYAQAIFHGVPLILIPAWFDQEYIARATVYQDVGIWLELAEVNQETLTHSLIQILDTGRFANNIKAASERFRDRPLSSVETAAWWTEYVLRHDTAHLRSPGSQQYWWQRRLLDFWFCIFVSLGILGFFGLKVLRFVLRTVVGVGGNSNQKVKFK